MNTKTILAPVTAAALLLAVLAATAGAQGNLGSSFVHNHGLGWGNTNFGSSYSIAARGTAANAATGWFANTSYASIDARYRARVLDSNEHDVIRCRAHAFANGSFVTGTSDLTIGNLDFVFWPQGGSYKHVGGTHEFSHWYGWEQWFGRLVQGQRYFSGILCEARMSSTVKVRSDVTLSKSLRRARVKVYMRSYPTVTVQVVGNATAWIEGHIRPLIVEDSTLEVDARQATCYGRGVVDYNNYVSMIMWIKRLNAPKIMLANTGMVPRDYFPQSMWVGGKYYNGFLLWG